MHAVKITPTLEERRFRGWRFWLIASYLIALLAGVPRLLMDIAPHFVFQFGLFGGWVFWGFCFGITWIAVVVVSLAVYRTRALWMLLAAPLGLYVICKVVFILFECTFRGPCI